MNTIQTIWISSWAKLWKGHAKLHGIIGGILAGVTGLLYFFDSFGWAISAGILAVLIVSFTAITVVCFISAILGALVPERYHIVPLLAKHPDKSLVVSTLGLTLPYIFFIYIAYVIPYSAEVTVGVSGYTESLSMKLALIVILVLLTVPLLTLWRDYVYHPYKNGDLF